MSGAGSGQRPKKDVISEALRIEQARRAGLVPLEALMRSANAMPDLLDQIYGQFMAMHQDYARQRPDLVAEGVLKPSEVHEAALNDLRQGRAVHALFAHRGLDRIDHASEQIQVYAAALLELSEGLRPPGTDDTWEFAIMSLPRVAASGMSWKTIKQNRNLWRDVWNGDDFPEPIPEATKRRATNFALWVDPPAGAPIEKSPWQRRQDLADRLGGFEM